MERRIAEMKAESQSRRARLQRAQVQVLANAAAEAPRAPAAAAAAAANKAATAIPARNERLERIDGLTRTGAQKDAIAHRQRSLTHFSTSAERSEKGRRRSGNRAESGAWSRPL